MYSLKNTESHSVGFPIRISVDQKSLALPHSLSQPITSFIASYRQGIHQMLFSYLYNWLNTILLTELNLLISASFMLIKFLAVSLNIFFDNLFTISKELSFLLSFFLRFVVGEIILNPTSSVNSFFYFFT